MFFQSMLDLFDSFPQKKKEIVISQLVSYQMPDDFFAFLNSKMDQGNLSTNASKTILDISTDYVVSLDMNFSLKNLKQFVMFLYKLFALKAQPTSFEKYVSFLQISFRIVNQINQEEIFSKLTKLPNDQCVIPLAMLCSFNNHLVSRALEVILSSYINFKKEQNLEVWLVAITALMKYSDSISQNEDKNLRSTIDSVLADKFVSLQRKFRLVEAALHFLPQKSADEIISTHGLILLGSVTVASPVKEVALALSTARALILRIKKNPINGLNIDQIVDEVFLHVLPAYRTNRSVNADLLEFCEEIEKTKIQQKIIALISANPQEIELSTLFLISRFPTPETLPFLLSKKHQMDRKSQYSSIFHYFSHNLVPFRYLPRLFEILESDDLHFLNEIFEQKPQLYCTAAIKFIAQSKQVEKIEFLSSLFAKAKTLPIVNSPYAKAAFLVVACLRANSKSPGCPIRLMLDYLHRCIEYGVTAKIDQNNKNEIHDENNDNDNNNNNTNDNNGNKADHFPISEIAADDGIEIEEEEEEIVEYRNKDENEEGNGDKGEKVDQSENNDLETAQVKTSEESTPEVSIPSDVASKAVDDTLDLTDSDISSLSSPSNSHYDVIKSLEALNRPSFCQSQAIRDWSCADPEVQQDLIDMALEQVKQGNTIFTVIIGSLSDDPILIHNCVQTLAQCDLFLLAFFFTTAASCNPQIVLRELKDYVLKEPEAAPRSFVSRLFTSRPSTIQRRQRIARRCIIGMAPFVPFSQYLYDTLIAALPSSSSSSSSLTSSSNSSSSAANSSTTPEINPNSNTSLTCECIIAVCTRLTHQEVLHSLIDRVVAMADAIDSPLLVPAIISILRSNQTLTDSDAQSVIKLWVKLLLEKKTGNSTDFEKALLSSSKNAATPFLKEMERAIRINGDNPALFSSLKRAILVMPNFDLTKQTSLITLIIANSLSESEVTLEFSIGILRQTYRVSAQLMPLKGVVFSHDYIESVRPFFYELSCKFQSANLVQLVEALLLYYKENPTNHQVATVLFTYFAVSRDPQIFIKSKLIMKLATAFEKLTRRANYAAMLYLFRIFDLLNAADPTTFFKEFIDTPDNEFISIYIERYSRHSESLGALLIPKIVELKSIDAKWKEFLLFDRLIKLFNGFIKSFVRDTTAPDRIAGIIFSVLIEISTANLLRKRGIKIDTYLSIFGHTLSEICKSTGIELLYPNFSLANDVNFYETFHAFAYSFQYLQHEVTDLLLTSLNSLISTKHNEAAILSVSSFLSYNAHAHSEHCKRLKGRAVDIFTQFLKKCQFDTSLIGFIIARSPEAFSANTLKQLNAEALGQFLNLSLESANKSHEVIPPLELLLGIVRSSAGPFISGHVNEIIETLRNSVNAGKIKVDSILVLNIIGELGRRKPDPTSLLKDSSVSFRSLAPLLLSEDNEIRSRVNAIFSLMIFGTVENPDFELIFSSLMSLYFGYENDTTHYVAITNDVLKTVERLPTIKKSNLELLKHIFSPVLSVGDATCNVAVSDFLKFLRKIANNADEDISTYAISTMTVFAKPKRNIQISNKS